MDFDASPFNPVDNIILSQLSYLALDNIVPGPEDKGDISISDAAKAFHKKLSSQNGAGIIPTFKEDPDLFQALGTSKRFADCSLFGFVNKIDTVREIQFSAVSVRTGGSAGFTAFRGTDTSVVGWKEDFNMCFREVIPSQTEAGYYLENMASHISGSLRIGGHSKGGNLAIYAASNCGKNIQERITDVYANDSPGFHKNILSRAGYASVKNRIRAYVPQSSIIGMLLNHSVEHIVIKSGESGLMQHNLYSWEVTHNDLVRAEKPTTGSRFINKTLHEWLDNIENEHRKEFIEALFHILTSSDVKSFSELEKSWFEAVGKVLKSISHMDESKRKIIRKTLKELIICGGRNIESLIKQKIDD